MSYEAILTANPNVLILDIEAGQTQGTTSIRRVHFTGDFKSWIEYF